MQKLDIKLEEAVVVFHGNSLPMEVIKSDRKTFGLTVTPDMKVILRVPTKSTQLTQSLFLEKKSPWLYKQLLYFDQFHPRRTIRIWQSGETHLYLGKEYLLRVQKGPTWEITVGENNIFILCPTPERKDLIQTHYREWLRKEAEKLFPELHRILRKRFEKKLGFWLNPPKVVFSKTKWGFYDPATQQYTMNYLLMQAPMRCIEYVILHEMVHHKYLDHDRRFFSLLTALMPDWRKWKDQMEKMLA